MLALVTPCTLSSLPNELIHIFKRKYDKNQYDNESLEKIWGMTVTHI